MGFHSPLVRPAIFLGRGWHWGGSGPVPVPMKVSSPIDTENQSQTSFFNSVAAATPARAWHKMKHEQVTIGFRKMSLGS